MCAAALAVALLFGSAAASSAPAGAPGNRASDARPRPSSFAPRAGAHRHDYGSPIQSQILHHRNPPRRNPAAAPPPLPQLQ
jgi:hypothetical protein